MHTEMDRELQSSRPCERWQVREPSALPSAPPEASLRSPFLGSGIPETVLAQTWLPDWRPLPRGTWQRWVLTSPRPL
jgi:hypothetical protein